MYKEYSEFQSWRSNKSSRGIKGNDLGWICYGRFLLIHWFQGSVNDNSYNNLLEEKVWSSVSSKASRIFRIFFYILMGLMVETNDILLKEFFSNTDKWSISLLSRLIWMFTLHTAENGPSGFKSKNLNFFFGLCLYAGYWVIFSIFRKCHLGNFEQIKFKKL